MKKKFFVTKFDILRLPYVKRHIWFIQQFNNQQ